MRLGERALLRLDDRDSRFDARTDVRGQGASQARRILARIQQATRDHLGDDRRRQFVQRRQQPAPLRHRPFAAATVFFVELAVDPRPDIVAPVVEFFLQRVLHHLALFLDHQDLVEAGCELAHRRRLQRPDHPALEDPDTQARAGIRVEPEVVQRLHRIEVGLAAGQDAEPGVGRIDDGTVQAVGPHIRQRRVPLVVEEPRLLVERGIGPADVEPMRVVVRIREVLGDQDLHAVGVDLDRCGGLDHLGHGLHRDPQAGPARHRPAMQTEVEVFLDRRGVEHRQAAGLEDVVRLVRQRGALRTVIVAGQHQHAAMARRACCVRMLEHIAASVDARPLAVPHREHAVDLGSGRQAELLRAPDRGRREVFVQPGLEHDPVLLQMIAGLPERLVDTAQRRTAVAGHEARGIQTGTSVAFALQHRQTHQRLRSRHEGAAALERVLVVEGDFAQCAVEVGAQRRIHGGVHDPSPSDDRVSVVRREPVRPVRVGFVTACGGSPPDYATGLRCPAPDPTGTVDWPPAGTAGRSRSVLFGAARGRHTPDIPSQCR